jgi:putative ABC transport system permease protein
VGWLSKLAMRLRALRRGEDVHCEIAEEWQFHLEQRTEENIRRGLSPEEARRQAVQHFGNSRYIKDLSWDERGGGIMETMWKDLRFGYRQLRKSPGFTCVALVSLALGIGANAMIFSLISTILLRPLPITHPERVFAVHQVKEKNLSAMQSMSYPNYKDVRDRNEVLSGLAVYRFAPMSVSHNGSNGSNERMWGYLVSGNYFEVLGLNAFLGRTFNAEEDQGVDAHPVVVVSYGCWQRRFGADPGVVGSSILVNGHSFTLIGVTKPEFSGTESIFKPEFWVPSMMQPWIELDYNGLDSRDDGQWFAFGRLKTGVSASQAQAQLNGVAKQLAKEHPENDEGMAFVLTPPGLVIPSLRNAMIAFSGALLLTVVLVLLIACTNLASLLLARAASRRKEIAVRLAIGATRFRLARQLLTESVLLSVTGGLLGLGLGVLLMRFVRASIPPTDVGITLDLRMDWRVVCFVAALALLTGIAFGLIPALQASRPDLVSSLQENAAGSLRRARVRNVLVTMQVALSLVLLITAGLTVRSLQHAELLGPGFNPEHALMMSVDLGLQGYDEHKGQKFYEQMAEQVRTLPGVQSAAWASSLPLSLDIDTNDVYPEGQPRPSAGDTIEAITKRVGPDYFATVGTPLVAGREFTANDKDDAPNVGVINETFAQRFWPGQNAVGKRFHDGGERLIQVVGVARNGKYQSYGEDPKLALFFPLAQRYSTSAALVVRTLGDPKSAIASVRNEIYTLDSNLPVYEVKTLQEHLQLPLFPLHAAAAAVGSFGVVALILAAIGIYGVMAYSVSQRTQEIGIRMALGARTMDVWGMVLRHGIGITAAGMVLGLLCAFALARVVTNLLYGVSATDPRTFILISLLLGIVALLACVIPARRATRVDPVIAIKNL